ncbi:hypothetical protein [Teredinibacter turnerae]|uniref:hypothetical protein n=1 Tax=Teredinibacter turnerae TaxID=2426 RepID=UPI0030CA9C25
MKSLDNIVALFSSDRSVIKQQENNSEYKCEYALTNPHRPSYDELVSCLRSIPKRDEISITYKIESAEDQILNDRSRESIENFLINLESKLSLRDPDDSIELHLRVFKKVLDGAISIYSLEDVANFWKESGIVSSLKKIEELVSRVQVLLVNGLEIAAKTNSLIFLPFEFDYKGSEANGIDRSEIYTLRDKVSHFANASQFSFIPEDFHIHEIDPVLNAEIRPLFEELRLVSSLIYLCDFSKFDELGNIHLRLGGYRLYAKDISAKERISGVNSEYYEIYKWAYGDGDVIDKVGLARNIISLHLIDNDLAKIQKGTLQSISSGYQVYLKDNVKQYIEIKNKLSEFIQGSSEKASEISKNVGAYYKNSIWTMYSFFASVFLIRVLSKSNQVLVTNEVFVLFFAFVIITLIIMRYALSELEDEKLRFIERYQSLKSRYCDLLIPDDLDRILESDKQHLSDLKYIDKKRNDYRWLWGLSISVIFVFVSLLWAAKL